MVHRIKKLIKRILHMFYREKMIPIPVPVDSNQLLKGKVALITGGSSGIGLSIAEAFVRSGCKVIIAGTNEEKMINECKRIGGQIKYVVLNVLDVQNMEENIQKALNMFEEQRIDILVNSAGVHHTNGFFEMEEEEYDRIMNINLKGTYYMCRFVSKHMIANGIKGHILNISSSSALRPASGPYQMSKWALRGFTMGLAKELLPYGIIVNALGAGQTATPMLGKSKGDSIECDYAMSGRYIMPSEIASLATFMVSDLGNMVVGDTFYMTGGSGIISLEK